jgi:hypothetical protein
VRALSRRDHAADRDQGPHPRVRRGPGGIRRAQGPRRPAVAKSRVQLPIAAAIALVERPELAVAYDLLGADGATFHGVADELRRVRAALSGPLRVSCAVRYRRRAFEDPALALRVTIDRELHAFAPDPGAALRVPFGDEPAAFAEPACVVEVKSRGGWPSWLPSLLAAHGAVPVEYSKFVVASRAVHGRLP